MQNEPVEVTIQVTRVLEKLNIPYLIGGSLASTLYGMVRTTQDSDIIAALHAEHVRPFALTLQNEFYVDEEMIAERNDPPSRLLVTFQRPHDGPAMSGGFQNDLVFRFQPGPTAVIEGHGGHAVVPERVDGFPSGIDDVPDDQVFVQINPDIACHCGILLVSEDQGPERCHCGSAERRTDLNGLRGRLVFQAEWRNEGLTGTYLFELEAHPG